MLNLYPYTSGHLLVSPYDHLGRIQDIPAGTITEMMDIARLAMNRLEDVYKPQGFNVGFNQGAAGAGIPGHTCTSSRAGAATPTSCPWPGGAF